LKKPNTTHQSRLFPYLLLLTLLYFLSHIVVFLLANNTLGLIATIVAKRSASIPLQMLFQQALFGLIVVMLYVLFAGVVWLLTRLMGYGFSLTWKRTWRLGLILWCIMALTVLFANAVYFTGSSINLVILSLLPMWLSKVCFWTLLGLCALAFFGALLGVLRYLKTSLIRSATGIALLGALLGLGFHTPVVASQQKTDRPNVIILSVDSLRPDFIGPDHQHGQAGQTPFYDHIVPQMTYFTDAFTAQARTYPSWAAILIGKYPKQNGVRFNLAPEKGVDVRYTLSHRLQEAGYYTLLATDDRQFDAMSQYYGFNDVLGPPAKVNNYLLSDINDLPLVNVLINTRVGRFLFPYNYANRASSVNYMPSSFDHQVEAGLARSPHNRPIFLAVHFCLPHFPYTWNDADQDEKLFPVGLYVRSVARADRQVANLYHYLKVNHYLDHAVLMILSDHGESLTMHGDRLISKAKFVKGTHSRKNVFKLLRTDYFIASSPFDGSYGHGTDVLALSQNRIVLGFQLIGMPRHNAIRSVSAPVSTIDIKPTVLSLLNLPIHHGSGRSLAPYIYGQHYDGKQRARFVESGFSPGDNANTTLSKEKLAVEGMKFFHVEPSGALVFRHSLMARALRYKQRAVFDGHWALAIYVKYDKSIPVLVNMKTGYWTDDLQSTWAKHSPVKQLFAKLKAFYGNEIVLTKGSA
jgi:arylsulfatase A-like enzyme